MGKAKKLSEKQALEQASAEGIEFVDDFILVNGLGSQVSDDGYATVAEAEAARDELDDSKHVQVAQRRRQAQPTAKDEAK